MLAACRTRCQGIKSMKRRDFSKMIVGATSVGSMMTLPMVKTAAAMTRKLTTVVDRVDRAHRFEWAKEHFRGFENVLVASFTPDLKNLDEAGIRLDVQKSIEHGFFSTLIAPAALSQEELKRVMQIAVDEADGRIAIGFALHAGPEAETFDLIEHGEKVGCQHFLLDLPREGSQEDLYRHGAKYSEATDLGIYLWMAQVHNFKRFHSSAIPFELFDRMADHPNIIALKVGNMDPAVVFELFERYNDRMLIGSMWPNIMPFAIKTYGQQWSGAWTVEALQSPETPYGTEFFNLMMRGKYEQGMKLYWSNVAPGFGAMMKMMGRYMASGAHPWELIKYYQFVVGGNGGRMRVDAEHPDIPPVSAEDMGFVRGVHKKLRVQTTDLSDKAFDVGRANWKARLRN